LVLLAWLKALTARQRKTVGVRLAGDVVFEIAIASKPAPTDCAINADPTDTSDL
jgi:hypothetical protein